MGQVVHVLLQDQGGLGRAGAAIRAHRRLVRQNFDRLDGEVRQAVGPAKHEGGNASGRAGEAARVENHPRLHSGQRAVALHPHLQLDDGLGRRCAGEDVLGARQRQAHRPPQPKGHRRHQRLEHGKLGPERPANGQWHNLDGGFRNTERAGDGLPHAEHRLGRGVDREAVAQRRWLGQGDVRLDIRLVDHRRAVGSLQDHIGLGEALRHVAACEVAGGRDIRPFGRDLGLPRRYRAVRRQLLRLAGQAVGPHQWRALRHRQQRVHRRVQHLVLDAHSVHSIHRLGFGRRDHGRYRLTSEQHPFVGQHGVGAGAGLAGRRGQVGGGQYRHDAGHLERPAGVDAPQAGMGIRAEHQANVQQPGQLDVAAEARASRHTVAPVQ